MNNFLENRPLVGCKGAVISQPVPGFQPMLSPNAPMMPRAEAAPDDAGREGSPQIELIENGGKLERIIVTCTCCNRIELQCQY